MDSLKVAELLNDYSVECKESRQYHTAKVALERAIKLRPTASVLWANLGVVLWNLCDFEGAEKALKKSIHLAENNHEAETVKATPWANYGLLCASMQRWDDSEKLFNTALKVEEGRLQPKWDMACMYLEKGDWEKGLDLYECRMPFKKYPSFPFPTWNGENLNGKTLFVQAEQGMGDRILFSRYLYWIHQTYPDCKILFLTDPNCVSLMWEFRSFVEFYPTGVPFPKADYGIYMLSIPRIHGTRTDFVPPDPKLIKKRVEAQKGYCNIPEPHMKSLKVGISWTGNPEQDLNSFRSIPFEQILGLASHPRVTLYGLQVGPGESDIKSFNADQLVCNLGPDLKEKGFLGTGQALMNLDLVITCCTSVAHLCGVLDVPCWVLLSRNCYWVWLTQRKDTVWYDSLKLYRQNTPGKWNETINTVKKDLFDLADKLN